MRKDLLSEEQMNQALSFFNPIFENDGKLFKKMLEDGSAFLESKSFTIFKNAKAKTALIGDLSKILNKDQVAKFEKMKDKVIDWKFKKKVRKVKTDATTTEKKDEVKKDEKKDVKKEEKKDVKKDEVKKEEKKK